ncbi:hypothetical protein [Roseimicrobium sp. ORNL1]|uniref:hypothetical protein n=1 Tax=Roseimicrobium sp. ORNL1 TaxID=2711231 RepID=UPI00197F009F|nr:hypothetical protein [Roseimicrobium sp. ORNL1]
MSHATTHGGHSGRLSPKVAAGESDLVGNINMQRLSEKVGHYPSAIHIKDGIMRPGKAALL